MEGHEAKGHEAEPRWLKIGQVIAVHSMLIEEHGGDTGIRDRGLIESTLSRSKNKFFYGSGSPFEIAVVYAYGLNENHGFVDGNKRIGATAMAMFLALNGYELRADQPELVIMMEGVAKGRVGEGALAEWIEDNVTTVRSDEE